MEQEMGTGSGGPGDYRGGGMFHQRDARVRSAAGTRQASGHRPGNAKARCSRRA